MQAEKRKVKTGQSSNFSDQHCFISVFACCDGCSFLKDGLAAFYFGKDQSTLQVG